MWPRGEPPPPDLAIPGDPAEPGAPPGYFVPLVDDGAERSPLDRWHRALADVERGRPGARARLVVFGASGTATDLWTGYLRTYLQARFGDAGPGLILPARPNKYFRHNELELQSSAGWVRATPTERDKLPDLGYGLLAQTMRAFRPGEWAELRVAKDRRDDLGLTSFTLWFWRQPGGGRVELEVDGRSAGIVDTNGPPGFARHVQLVDAGPARLRLTTLDEAEVRLFAIDARTDRPGVIVDAIGIVGARATIHLVADEAVWAAQLAHLDPDLVIWSYGTNEAADPNLDLTSYADKLRAVLLRMRRAAPDAACVLFGPPDFPEKVGRGRSLELRERPILGQIIARQREIALEAGCAFWDGLAFMGGPGSMRDWVEHQPPYAGKDYLHLTRRGMVRLGHALADAIMLEYDSSP